MRVSIPPSPRSRGAPALQPDAETRGPCAEVLGFSPAFPHSHIPTFPPSRGPPAALHPRAQPLRWAMEAVVGWRDGRGEFPTPPAPIASGFTPGAPRLPSRILQRGSTVGVLPPPSIECPTGGGRASAFNPDVAFHMASTAGLPLPQFPHVHNSSYIGALYGCNTKGRWARV